MAAEVPVELGVMLPSMSRRDERPGDIPALARQADPLGFESVWVVDQLVAGTGVPVLDSLTSLAAAAAVTERVRLGVGVLIAPLRPVAWIAKQVATLPYLSGDRRAPPTPGPAWRPAPPAASAPAAPTRRSGSCPT